MQSFRSIQLGPTGRNGIAHEVKNILNLSLFILFFIFFSLHDSIKIPCIYSKELNNKTFLTNKKIYQILRFEWNVQKTFYTNTLTELYYHFLSWLLKNLFIMRK